jgi:hypothetical protein
MASTLNSTWGPIDLFKTTASTAAKIPGISVRFVVPSGTLATTTRTLPQLKFHGADQVSDIFNEEDIDLVEREASALNGESV